jgi:hypothetical protein
MAEIFEEEAIVEKVALEDEKKAAEMGADDEDELPLPNAEPVVSGEGELEQLALSDSD